MAQSPETKNVTLTLDGKQVTAPHGTTIWHVARDADIDIPHL